MNPKEKKDKDLMELCKASQDGRLLKQMKDKMKEKGLEGIIFWHTAQICSLEETGALTKEEEIEKKKQIYKDTLSAIEAHYKARRLTKKEIDFYLCNNCRKMRVAHAIFKAQKEKNKD